MSGTVYLSRVEITLVKHVKKNITSAMESYVTKTQIIPTVRFNNTRTVSLTVFYGLSTLALLANLAMYVKIHKKTMFLCLCKHFFGFLWFFCSTIQFLKRGCYLHKRSYNYGFSHIRRILTLVQHLNISSIKFLFFPLSLLFSSFPGEGCIAFCNPKFQFNCGWSGFWRRYLGIWK